MIAYSYSIIGYIASEKKYWRYGSLLLDRVL